MTAILTQTSQTVEARIVSDNGNEISTTYHNNLNEALDRAAQLNVRNVEIEDLNI